MHLPSSRTSRFSRTAAVVAAALSIAAVPTGPAGAQPLFGSGKWAAPLGANSWCEQVATTTVRCFHHAAAGNSLATASNCRSEALDLGSIVIIGTCQVTLEATTSGAGRVVGEFAPGCTTFGLDTGTLTFSDSSGFSYPPVTISVVNLGGVAHFNGSTVNSAGVVVARTEGTFTMACGGSSGSFKGTYETF